MPQRNHAPRRPPSDPRLRRGRRQQLRLTWRDRFAARTRRARSIGLLLLASLLIVNALVGDEGLVDSLRAGHHEQQLAADLERLRTENTRLRSVAARLRDDLGTIEDVARDELGLIMPDERLFLLAESRRPAPAP